MKCLTLDILTTTFVVCSGKEASKGSSAASVSGKHRVKRSGYKAKQILLYVVMLCLHAPCELHFTLDYAVVRGKKREEREMTMVSVNIR